MFVEADGGSRVITDLLVRTSNGVITMSRIAIPAIESATGSAAELFAQIKQAAGKVPNTFAVIGSLAPAALQTILQADQVLGRGSLSKQDQETIKLFISELAGCDYCAAAHTQLAKTTGLSPAVVRQIRAGQPTGDAKRDALLHLLDKLVRTSGTISKQEFSAIKAAGYSDQQLVDISLAIAVISFTNIFNRINDTELDYSAVA
jgi:uncharacterized peroxidase-related enzyme